MSLTNTKKLLVNRDAKVLRGIAKAVLLKDISTKKITDIVAKMKRAMHAEDDGVAIAAPQVGSDLRIFIVSGKAVAIAKGKEIDAEEELQDLVFFNPEIIKASKKKMMMEEGCLSLRYLYGFVSRHEKVTMRAVDENGKLVTLGASGLLAQIFQHETDHLNGVLFTDKAENVRDLPPTQDEA